jgi:ligand-binding SRPBCC domain-containing protein
MLDGEVAMHFVKESRIAAPPAVVFAFHEAPGILERLTPPWEPVTVVEGGNSLLPGSRVVLRIHLGPFSVRWVAEHTEYVPGRLFADRQVHGPFARWDHRHLFLDDGAGGTRLRDEVEYEPPLGRLGRWLGGAFIEHTLRKMFDYRHEMTSRIVASGDFSGATSASGSRAAGAEGRSPADA